MLNRLYLPCLAIAIAYMFMEVYTYSLSIDRSNNMRIPKPPLKRLASAMGKGPTILRIGHGPSK